MRILKAYSLFSLFALFAAGCLITAGLVAGANEENKNAPPLYSETDFSRFAGETLVYSIKWEPPWYMFFLPKMEAGELTFRFKAVDEFRGKPVVKIIIEARSSGTLVKLTDMKVEDEFIYYSSPETLCSEGSSSKTREGKRQRRVETEYFQNERRLHYRLFDESATPPQLLRDITKTDVPPCVYDPFSALYLYRTLPLAKGYAKTLTVGNNDKVLEVRARVEKQETVSTQSGKIAAWKVKTDALSGGLFREDGDFCFWLSSDERKLPVRFEASVRLGCIIGVLKSEQP